MRRSPVGASEIPTHAPSTFSSRATGRRSNSLASTEGSTLSVRGRVRPSQKRCGVRGNLTKESSTLRAPFAPATLPKFSLIESLDLILTQKQHRNTCPFERFSPAPPFGIQCFENRRAVRVDARHGHEFAISTVKGCEAGFVGKLFEVLLVVSTWSDGNLHAARRVRPVRQDPFQELVPHPGLTRRRELVGVLPEDAPAVVNGDWFLIGKNFHQCVHT